jgi:hypothetical protein
MAPDDGPSAIDPPMTASVLHESPLDVPAPLRSHRVTENSVATTVAGPLPEQLALAQDRSNFLGVGA